MRKGEYMQVISHLDDHHEFLTDIIPKADHTVPKGSDATAPAALVSLRQSLVRATRGLPPITARERLTADVFGLARFQFGPGPANHLTRGCSVRGRPERPRLLDRSGEQLAMVDPTRGWLSLTLAGGQRLFSAGGPSLVIGDFKFKGDLFAGGIKEVRGLFQPGDEVALVRDETVVGVGVARLSSALLERSPRGLAVKVRHRA